MIALSPANHNDYPRTEKKQKKKKKKKKKEEEEEEEEEKEEEEEQEEQETNMYITSTNKASIFTKSLKLTPLIIFTGFLYRS